ncbi:MAG: methyltransferase domain-containing protein [Alphaproteobacteria bacterium]|nr:methyltransferase domain-containing protein [Alphaproteobacteria bacterium]
MSFLAVTVPEYADIARKRLTGEIGELTWLQQFADLLTPYLRPGRSIVDFGCCTGYAYRSFAAHRVNYIGVDFEAAFLDVARAYYGDDPATRFLRHDITSGPAGVVGDIVISSAMLEHCPALSPALENMAAAAGEFMVLRTFLGPDEIIEKYLPPVAGNDGGVEKYSNVYAGNEVIARLDACGFAARVIEDRYTSS